MKAALPLNERDRLAALRRYAVLDTPPEAAFDRITRLATRLLRVPISLVSLVDESRQWFKSSIGLPSRESSREASFCAHAILTRDVTVVTDATRDQRFVDNPLVTDDPRIRFYAGAPLTTPDGLNLGTLCAIDTVPRSFTPDEIETLRDLAALVQDELELRLAVRERNVQAAAVASLRSGVLVTDPTLPDNPIIFANPGFCAITGYDYGELIGRNCRLLQGAQTDAGTVAAIHVAVAERRPFQGLLLNYRKDGTTFWNELTITPVFGADGQLQNFVGLQSDVTERKLSADQLRQSFDQLRDLERLRDDLTSMIVHDLRSPLTAVLGNLDLMEMELGSKLAPDELELILQAREGARALQQMITSLLDVSRLEAGEMPMTMRSVDVRDVVRAATDPLIALIAPRHLGRNLPTAPIRVTCDADIMQRVVANLVSNAIKFTPDGGRIDIAVMPEPSSVRVSVSDTGPGIPSQFWSKIFEKFGQVGDSRHRHSTGLGLTFCKLAVEAHGGRIGVDSLVGTGSTFWFELKREEERDGDA